MKTFSIIFYAKLLILSICISLAYNTVYAEDPFYIGGRVKESLGKTDLTDAIVMTLNADGEGVDTCRCDRSLTIINGEEYRKSYFNFVVPRCDSVYTIEISCPNYITKTMTFAVKDIGKRESSRSIPVIFLERAPKQLNEMTVTATKIKFYNKGDTVVYNADAFELAEGSMLDALIEQLPGVELKEGGQIYVNGELVESLLLNGREFFNNDNELMLENIGAYTVKNIEVYKGHTTDEKWKKQTYGEKHLTMDVKLKREYNTGLTANAQAGYGTEDRYMARLFGMWYNSTTRLTLVGNFNNLNDTRKPGQKDSWTPDMMPSGTRKYNMAAFDYNHMNSDETKRFHGDLTYKGTFNDNRNTSYRTNFLTGGNTYENSFSKSNNKSHRLSSYHYGTIRSDKWMPTYVVKSIYEYKDNESEALSVAFSEDYTNMTYETLKALYTETDEATLKSILNRASTRTDGSSHTTVLQFFPGISYFVPRSDDVISNEFGIMYRGRKEDIWKDYTVNYGDNPIPSELRRQYIDNTPNREFGMQNNLTYSLSLNKVHMQLNYEYKFNNNIKDSYQYALDRLEDMGVFGHLPTGWINTLDPQNSYTSHLYQNTHSFSPSMYIYESFGSKLLYIFFSPDFSLRHAHMNYERAGRLYPIRRSFFLTTFGGYAAHIEYSCGYNEERQYTPKHHITFDYRMTPTTPDLLDLTDIVDDSNPLNIYIGNPDLKVQYTYNPRIQYTFNGPKTHPLMNTFTVDGSITRNALTQGYTYDTSTGIRTNRMYNVNGNRMLSASDNFSLQFGSKNQFTILSNSSAVLNRYADMIGINGEAPSLSKVDNRTLSQQLTFAWQIGRQNIRLIGNYTNRYSYSPREDFRTINANHFSYGIVANFKLPYNFGINTDFNVYSRRGYGVSELDTNDAIWNMRLTWTPPKAKEWVLMLDGFDMLHQLSNVNYAVTASGRTVSYSNALPRYMMLSVQYRFQRQPKKR